MKRVLVLGGGFGCIATAHRLKQKLGDEVDVMLVDRRPFFMVGFRKSWALVGESPLEGGEKAIEGLRKAGVYVGEGTGGGGGVRWGGGKSRARASASLGWM